MENDEVFKILEETETTNSDQAISNNQDLYYLVRSGISLILEGIEIVGSGKLDLDNMEEFVLKRYLYSVPFRANWTLRMIAGGYYSSGYSLMRVLFEEIISLEYYLGRLDTAKSAFIQESYIEPSVRRKLNVLGFEDDHDFKLIYKGLSEDYVHPKLLRLQVLNPAGDEVQPEPFYHQEKVESGFRFLLFLLTSGLTRMFLFNMDENASKNWKENSNVYLADVAKIQQFTTDNSSA